MAHLHCALPDGQKHLVLCGQPLLQVPLLLPGLLHYEILKRAPEKDGWMEEGKKERNVGTWRRWKKGFLGMGPFTPIRLLLHLPVYITTS